MCVQERSNFAAAEKVEWVAAVQATVGGCYSWTSVGTDSTSSLN